MRHLHIVPARTNVPFIAWRRVAMVVSILLVAGSLAMLFVRGLNFGIDFRGGILIEVRMPAPADLGELRGILGQLDLGEVSLQEFGEPTDVLIRIQRQEGAEDLRAAAQVVDRLEERHHRQRADEPSLYKMYRLL